MAIESEFLKQFASGEEQTAEESGVQSPFLRGFVGYEEKEDLYDAPEEEPEEEEEEDLDTEDIVFDSPEEEAMFRRHVPSAGISNGKDFFQPNRSTAKAMAPNDSATLTYNILRNNRYNPMSHAEASAYIGNLMEESGNFSNDVIVGNRRGDNGTAFGIAQWRGDRLANLKSFARSIGKDYRDLEAQANFIAYETNTTEKAAHQKVKASSGDIGAAARAVNKYYERSADKTNRREKNAYSFDKLMMAQAGGYVQAQAAGITNPSLNMNNYIGYSPVEKNSYMQGYGSSGVQFSPTDMATGWYKDNQLSSNIPVSPKTNVANSDYFNTHNFNPKIETSADKGPMTTGVPIADAIMKGVDQVDSLWAGQINTFKNVKDKAEELKGVVGSGVSSAATALTSILGQNANEEKYYKMLEDLHAETQASYKNKPNAQNLTKSML